jgi:hypothetical protein
MPRVKVKKIIAGDNDTTDQETLAELFEQMTGGKDAESEIILPKYINVMNMLKKIYRLYNLLCGLDVFANTFSEYTWVDEIKLFLNDIIEECELEQDANYTEEFIYSKYNELVEQKDTDSATPSNNSFKEYINIIYKKLKSSSVIKKIMITSANLVPFRTHLMKDIPSDTFIKREPGNTFTPLAFTTLDLRLIWNYDVEPKCHKFILNILQHTFKLSYEIYDIIYSPDIDINQFSDLLISTITKLRKQIPRCDRAFDVIEQSVNMLRKNFKDYFRVSVETENPSSILESFIVDVASTQKANPSVVAEFRRITMFMKKNASNNSDPRVKKLFSMLNMQFSKIDKEMKVNTRIDEEDNTDIKISEVNPSENSTTTTNVPPTIDDDIEEIDTATGVKLSSNF